MEAESKAALRKLYQEWLSSASTETRVAHELMGDQGFALWTLELIRDNVQQALKGRVGAEMTPECLESVKKQMVAFLHKIQTQAGVNPGQSAQESVPKSG